MERIIAILAKEFQLKVGQVERTIALLDEGNTVPFIARYRKEMTGGLSDEVLRELEDRLGYLRNLEARKEEVLGLIEEQGKLTQDLRLEIMEAEVLQRVEDLYRPFRPKRSTRATKAKEKGLEPLAEIIFAQGVEEGNLEDLAAPFINEELEVHTLEDALQGAMDIVAEWISDHPEYREDIRDLNHAKGVIHLGGGSR